ncbi:hypothetical protein BDR04DRAFT_1163584 [Suillus decipiens]|nr:hypothetical protein BDR04DRAFT_1163584 [Suillus decipiens]
MSPSSGGLRVGGPLILVAVFISLGLLVTYHWWRPNIPINSFCGCCLPVPRRRSKPNNCTGIVRMTSLGHPGAATATATATATTIPAPTLTTTAADHDSFWSADANEVEDVESMDARSVI